MRRYILNWILVVIIAGVGLAQCDAPLTELTVGNVSFVNKYNENTGSISFKCNDTKNVFRCNNGNCIPESNKCNGIPECDYGEDEHVRHCGCLQNEFPCTNSCISLEKRCDRIFDCEGGEDEENCEAHVCPRTHFKCENHFCIPTDWTCNFINDCGDNSDESNCSSRPCWHQEARCGSGQCIRLGSICDGKRDCVDGFDEAECDEDKHFVKCGDGTLIHHHLRCDGHPDCGDNHADELNCGSCEDERFYKCANGRCIKRANICDAYCDCVPLDQDKFNSSKRIVCEDEENCDEFYTVENGITQCLKGASLTCYSDSDLEMRKLDRCIRQEFICDGIVDCSLSLERVDELGCNETDLESKFSCSDGRFLSRNVRCNFKIDCLDGEDEENCTYDYQKICKKDEEPLCRSGECILRENLCDHKYQCHDKSDEMNCSNIVCDEGWRSCGGSHCIPDEKWCDFSKDCLNGQDEADCVIRDCMEDEFRCQNGQCIPLAEHCMNNGKIRSGCVDGSHLLNCAEKVCPEGFYKCYRGPCLHESMKCNDVLDCRNTWDDEDNCTRSCTEQDCQCHDIHIDCTSMSLVDFPDNIELAYTKLSFSGNFLNNLTVSTFIHLNRTVFLDLSNNSITDLEPMTFLHLFRLKSLSLENNQITVLKNLTFFGLSGLTGLHLKNNAIKTLQSEAFYGLSSLPVLDLHGQKIDTIQEKTFLGLKSLNSLDLSWNEMKFFDDTVFVGMPKLRHLDVSHNKLVHIGPNVFRVPVALQVLKTDEFRFCCLARHVPDCRPLPDEFSSCEDLMTNLVLRICVWILGIVATFANILVIIFRSLYQNNTNKVHSFLIKNLALGDFLMGTYLLIIAFVDWQYRGTYSVHDTAWRASGMCNFAGFISTFSSELTVFTLTVITLDRFLVIIFPFRANRLEMNRTRFLMTAGWVLAALISIIPLPFFRIDYFRNFYGRSGVCLPLHITPDKPSGWEYSVFVFLFLNFLSFSVIAVSYLWMYLAARHTQRAVQRDSPSSESAMAFRMTLLVATDAACWIPIILLGFWSLAGYTVPPQVYAWIAVFVLPLNAAVNPVLYTLSTTRFMNPARRNIKLWKRSFSRNTRRKCYNSSAKSYDHTVDCATDELCPMNHQVSFVRWLRKVDTVVIDHGETMPLRRTTTLNTKS